MREALFIKRNKEKWDKFEAQPTTDPDILSQRFVETIDDLAYAQTFYPKSKTQQYLNERAVQFYTNIYKNKREKLSRFFDFWRFDLPLIIRKHHKQLLYAFSFFTVFCLIGALSAKYDSNFVRLILGDGYVNMTQENIENGQPFGVYDGGNQLLMFLRIAMNNIWVAFLVYIWGIFFTAGTVYHLFKNGIMLGSFQYFFFAKSLGMKSVLVIWVHGTLEISAIVIAGAAGFMLGNSILFPGTYSRLTSLRRAAMDSIKVLVGLIPIFLTAAFLEGFITRMASARFDNIHKNQIELTEGGSIAILTLSLAFIVWYFVIYPILLENKIQKATIII
jgi:uncharacterized membrane protein SpoIIM required for sporulation